MLALLFALTLAQDGVAPSPGVQGTPEAQSTPQFAHQTVKVTSTKTTVSVTIATADVHSVVLVPDGKPSSKILPTKTHKKDDKTFATFARPQGDFMIVFTALNKDKKGKEFSFDSSGKYVAYRVEAIRRTRRIKVPEPPPPPPPQRQWTQPRYFVPPAPSHRHT